MSLFEPTIPLSFHDASMASERARYDALLEKYHSLKLVGAVEVPKPVDDLDPTGVTTAIAAGQRYQKLQQPADEMRDLIDARAGNNLQMRKQMLRRLALDRSVGVDEDTIRTAIYSGVTSDGVPNG